MVFWTVCTQNYIVMRDLNCAFQLMHCDVILHIYSPKYCHSNDNSNCTLLLSCENSHRHLRHKNIQQSFRIKKKSGKLIHPCSICVETFRTHTQFPKRLIESTASQIKRTFSCRLFSDQQMTFNGQKYKTQTWCSLNEAPWSLSVNICYIGIQSNSAI